MLFFKGGTPYANTPPGFRDYLHAHYPQLLDPAWQQERTDEFRRHFPSDRVLFGPAGFAALAAPHLTGSLP